MLPDRTFMWFKSGYHLKKRLTGLTVSKSNPASVERTTGSSAVSLRNFYIFDMAKLLLAFLSLGKIKFLLEFLHKKEISLKNEMAQ